MSDPQTTWTEWSKHVLLELQRLNQSMENLEEKLSDNNEKNNKSFQDLKVEVAMLKVKSGVWGLMGGLIPVLIALLIHFISK